MRQLLTLIVLILLAWGLEGLSAQLPAGPGTAPGAAAALTGFLLLAAYLAGSAARQAGVPRITGYILLGAVVGPGLLGILTAEDVSSLGAVDDIAISLIALTAGAELRVREIRPRARAIGTIIAAEMATVFVVVGGAILLLSPWLPLTRGLGPAGVGTVAIIFGSIAIANSPSVAVALINETRSKGPVTTTVLSVTVLKDVAVIILFALALSLAQRIQNGEGAQTQFHLVLVREIGGSLLVGALSGWALSRYLLRHRAHPVLFVLGIAVLNAQVAAFLHMEVLLLSLSAGFFVENLSGAEGERLLAAARVNSLPFYALFFSLAGAKIEMTSLGAIGPFVAVLVLLRGMAVFGGTRLGARLAGAEETVRAYAWTGLISQAGVTLGMVVIAVRAFPEWGAEMTTLFVAMVAIHELVGPVLFQHGLQAAGEVGMRDKVEMASPTGASPAATRRGSAGSPAGP